MSSLGFSEKQTLRWRFACKKLGAECAWDIEGSEGQDWPEEEELWCKSNDRPTDLPVSSKVRLALQICSVLRLGVRTFVYPMDSVGMQAVSGEGEAVLLDQRQFLERDSVGSCQPSAEQQLGQWEPWSCGGVSVLQGVWMAPHSVPYRKQLIATDVVSVKTWT